MTPSPPRASTLPYTTLFRSNGSSEAFRDVSKLQNKMVTETGPQVSDSVGQTRWVKRIMSVQPFQQLPGILGPGVTGMFRERPIALRKVLSLAKSQRSEEHTSELQSRGHLV